MILRVFIVEDEEMIRKGLVHTINWAGMGCLVVGSAADGRSGLSSILQKRPDVVITDECQFFTPAQIDQLRRLVDERDLPVLCFGLRTDFLTHLFPGSLRLFELADSITEIKTICACGSKATVNARIDSNGHVVTKGEQVFLGGNDSYLAMCHSCWKKRIAQEAAEGTKQG